MQILDIIVSNFQYTITNKFFITVQYGSFSASLYDLCAYTHTWRIEESFCYSAKSLYLLLNFFVFTQTSFKNPQCNDFIFYFFQHSIENYSNHIFCIIVLLKQTKLNSHKNPLVYSEINRAIHTTNSTQITYFLFI